MILSSTSHLQPTQWQRELADAINSPSELLTALDLLPRDLPDVDLAEPNPFPLRVPRYFAGLMRRGDAHDPLLAQVLPRRAEHLARDGFGRDPVGDLDALHDNAVLQKYGGRALAITTGACAVHCRYCFRRHFPYAEQTLIRQWQASLRTLRGLQDVHELILSGGDPLSLSDARLAHLLVEVGQVAQLTRLRIHTRLPVVLPSRVTADLCALLRETRLRVVIVIHVNHPNEITPQLGGALAQLQSAGCTLLNQSVLLKDINDDADTLMNLSESLFEVGVMPYYLHMLGQLEDSQREMERRISTWTNCRPERCCGESARVCRATSCRTWCARFPARPARSR